MSPKKRAFQEARERLPWAVTKMIDPAIHKTPDDLRRLAVEAAESWERHNFYLLETVHDYDAVRAFLATDIAAKALLA